MGKKNSPGCLCCLGAGLHIGSRESSADIFIKDTTPPPRLEDGGTDYLLSTNFGGGSVAVGWDMERRKLLVQKTDGSIWTLNYNRTSPTLLWAAASDAGGKTLGWVKYHHSWGCASAELATTPPQMVSFDASGSITHGPYTTAIDESTGFFATDAHCVDASGNLYYYQTWNSGSTNQVKRNGVDYCKGGRDGSTDPVCFHNGSNLYVNGKANALDSAGILLGNPNNTSAPSLVASSSSIYGGAGAIRQGCWNAATSFAEISISLQFRRLSLDLQHNVYIADGVTTGTLHLIYGQ